MPLSTKEQRRRAFGPSKFVSKAEAANIRDCSIWKIDQEIKARILVAYKDEDTGAVKLLRASVEKLPTESEEFTPPNAA
jgi:hypothetical protein